ncbi:unnamed protein product [Cylindrotheca closterium]|uniref:Uncharacterized protein n=1 Tax=Cylindrotheca closterium TaxID=2856 RepID=A0AAD2JM22_9STRA|nr:unnamed protein product [Cylindrotheca closterium]
MRNVLEIQSNGSDLLPDNVVDHSLSNQQCSGRQIIDQDLQHGSSLLQPPSRSQPGAFAISRQHRNSLGYESGTDDRTFVATLSPRQVSETDPVSPEATTLSAEIYEERAADAAAFQDDYESFVIGRARKRAAFALTVILIVTVSIVIASTWNRKTREDMSLWESEEKKPLQKASGWPKVGNTILGPTNQDNIRFGLSVAVSSTGTRIAVGLPGLDLHGEGTMYEAGGAFVFDFNGTDWVLVGEINGQAQGAKAGISVKLSNEGGRLAIGCPGWSENDGYVAVYEEAEEGKWSRLGEIMIGAEGKGEHFGSEVALSADGNFIAVGSKFASTTDENEHTLQNTGAVNVFRFTGQEWKRAGNTIYGGNTGDLLGWAVAISGNGMRIAAAALGFDTFAGQMLVFDLLGEVWQRTGDDFVGTEARENFGASVALSEDGRTLAVGATGYSIGEGAVLGAGRVQIFQWEYASWSLVASISGESKFQKLGLSLALSSAGKKCGVGAPGIDVSTGFVRVLEQTSEGWVTLGSDINDEGAIGGRFGGSVDLSSDGNVVVLGAPLATFDGLRSEVGHALVYQDT